MARSIYATFTTERNAESATGALLDHGVAAEDVSFVISDPLLHPSVFQPETSFNAERRTGDATVDAVPPPARPLPGTYVSAPNAATAQLAYPSNESGSASAALSSPSAVDAGISASSVATYARPVNQPHATTLAPNTPQDIVEHERRPHIIDMESERPRAADGISTTTTGDAAKGAAGGAGIGIGLGILLGIAAVMVPGVGLIAGTGALVAGLAAATGVAGGVAGGVYGYLADLGIPPHNARLLGDHLNAGGVVLHIEVAGNVSEEQIMSILTKYGATSAQGF
jgi:hypothetical protein